MSGNWKSGRRKLYLGQLRRISYSSDDSSNHATFDAYSGFTCTVFPPCDTSEGQNACPSQAPRRYTTAVMMAVMKIQRSWNQ